MPSNAFLTKLGLNLPVLSLGVGTITNVSSPYEEGEEVKNIREEFLRYKSITLGSLVLNFPEIKDLMSFLSVSIQMTLWLEANTHAIGNPNFPNPIILTVNLHLVVV